MKKLLLSIAFLLPGMGMMAQTQVTTAEGILEGKDLSGITVFKGIPFAAPPVGNLRWKARSLYRNGRAFARPRSSDRTRCRNLSSAI